jgi:hypothetical protein
MSLLLRRPALPSLILVSKPVMLANPVSRPKKIKIRKLNSEKRVTASGHDFNGKNPTPKKKLQLPRMFKLFLPLKNH